MLRFWDVPLHLQCASWSIVQFSRFKLIIWPAESNSKECSHESGWNWWNYNIWYANHRWTCMQMCWHICIQVCWHLLTTLNTICKETKPELTWATKVISKCRKIIKTADRHCTVWYITFLIALSLRMWPETGKEQTSAPYMQKTPVWRSWWLLCNLITVF